MYKVDRKTDRQTDRQTNTPGRGGVPGFPPKVIMGTEVRVDWPEGKGLPISVKSSADPYFLCLWGGEGRKNNIMEPYRWDGQREQEERRGKKEGSGAASFQSSPCMRPKTFCTASDGKLGGAWERGQI